MLKIHDLTKTEELDRNAMQAVAGGLTYTSAKSRFDDNVTTKKSPFSVSQFTTEFIGTYIYQG